MKNISLEMNQEINIIEKHLANMRAIGLMNLLNQQEFL
jgi:hypothetical protein